VLKFHFEKLCLNQIPRRDFKVMSNLNKLNDYILQLENLSHFTNMCLVESDKVEGYLKNRSLLFWSQAKDVLNIFWHLAVAATCG
jgi:hypothetical protein